MKLDNKKIVVTGGAGLIGSHLVDQLLKTRVREVIVIDNLTRGNLGNLAQAAKDPRLQFHQLDICSSAKIEPYFSGADGCFHLAALRITQCASEPRLALDIMINGSYNVFEACVKHRIKKVIFSSTASIYGMADHFPTDEKHHPWNNQTWYGATKLAGESMLKTFQDMFDLNYIALRYFNVYGPRMDVFGKYTEVLIRWIEQIENGQKPKIFGDGKQTMDFIYVEDVAKANILAMESDVNNDVFNIASGIETSLLDLLHHLTSALKIDSIQPEFLPDRKVNPVPRRLAEVRKAKEILGFSAKTGLEAGLQKLIEWRKQMTVKQK